MYVAKTLKLQDNRKIEIIQDSMAENPYMDWDMLTHIFSWNSRYSFCDKAERPEDQYQFILEKGKALLSAMKSESDRQRLSFRIDNMEEAYRSGTDEEVIKALKLLGVELENLAVWDDLYMYEHGGITIATTPFGCIWDSGRTGFAFVLKKEILSSFARERMTKKLYEQARKVIDEDVSVLDQFINGDVYGFQLYNSAGDIENDCWGFYGSNVFENGMSENFTEADCAYLRETNQA